MKSEIFARGSWIEKFLKVDVFGERLPGGGECGVELSEAVETIADVEVGANGAGFEFDGVFSWGNR